MKYKKNYDRYERECDEDEEGLKNRKLDAKRRPIRNWKKAVIERLDSEDDLEEIYN